MKRLLKTLSVSLVLGLGWTVGMQGPSQAEQVGYALPPAAEGVARYQEAAAYDPLLPALSSDESWHVVDHIAENGSTSGDLWLDTPSGRVHMWQTDLPALMIEPDPVGRGLPVTIGKTVWWRVDGVMGDAAHVQLATRTLAGLTITIDGVLDAVRSVAERLSD